MQYVRWIVSLLLPLLCVPRFAGAEAGTADIGLLLTLTGTFADFGDDCARGIAVANSAFAPDEVVGALRLRFVLEDSQGDPKQAVSAFRTLVTESGVSAVITMRSPIGMALNPVSSSMRVPLLGAVGHPGFVPGNPYSFQCWPTTEVEGRVLAEYARESGAKRVAVVTLEDEWTTSLSEHFVRVFERNGGTVIAHQSVLPGEMDFAPVFTKMKAARPDAVFLNLGTAQGAAAVKRLRELGYTGSIYSNFWIGDSRQIAAAGIEASEGVVFPEVALDLPNFQHAAAKALPAKRPSGMTYSCYSAAALLLQALADLKGAPTPSAVYDSLLSQHELRLLDGTIELKERRGQYEVVIKKITAGKVMEVRAES